MHAAVAKSGNAARSNRAAFGLVGSSPTRRIIVRSRDEVRLALFLTEEGFNQSQIERLTGIPRRTVGDWVRLGPPGSRPGRRPTRTLDPAEVPRRPYAYLLGLYLGDGYICRCGRAWRLRIAMDSGYPAIIEEARCAVGAVLAPNNAHVQRMRNENSVEVQGYSNSLPTLFPQHGPGRKHTPRSFFSQVSIDNHGAVLPQLPAARDRVPVQQAHVGLDRPGRERRAPRRVRRPHGLTPVARMGMFLQSR